MGKVFYRANEFKEQILQAKEKTFERGYLPGFRTLDDFMSFKRGYTTYLYAFPHTGKSVFMSDLLIHQAKRYNNKIAIFSPEFGKKESLIHSLVQTFVGKKMYGENKQFVSDDEWIHAMDFIDNHFVILDPPKKSRRKDAGLDFDHFNLEAAFNEVFKAKKQYGWDISLFVIDPMNHMEKSDIDRKKQTADYVLDSLMFVNEASETLNLHTIIVNHLRDAERITDKETGIEYYPKGYPGDLLGGQNNWRAGQQMINLHRNPAGVIEKSTGIPYPECSTEVLIQKSKPHSAGKVGDVRLYFDDFSQKFYEIVDGHKFFAGEYELKFGDVPEEMKPKSAIQPSSSWYEVDKEPELFKDDNEPF